MSDDETPIRVSKPAFPKYLLLVAALALFSLGVLAFGVVAAVRYSQRETTAPTQASGPLPLHKVSPETLPSVKETVKASPPVRNGAPEAIKEGTEWSVEELAKYLDAKGVLLSWERDANDVRVVHAKGRLGAPYSITRHPGPIQAEIEALKRPWGIGYGCVWGAFSFDKLTADTIVASFGCISELAVNEGKVLMPYPQFKTLIQSRPRR